MTYCPFCGEDDGVEYHDLQQPDYLTLARLGKSWTACFMGLLERGSLVPGLLAVAVEVEEEPPSSA